MTRTPDDGAAPAGDATPEDVVEAIHAVMHGFRARQHRAQRDGEQDLAHMEAKALGFFARHPGATQRDLVLRSGRDKGQVARLIAGLRERGLLDAQADEADRRSVRLTVSATGRKVQAAQHAHARALSEHTLAGLSPDERRQLVGLLGRMLENLGRD